MKRVTLLALLGFAAIAPAFAQDAASLDALIDAERLTLENECKSLELGRDFIRRVDIDGNSRDDVVLDFGQVDCDGSDRRYCGQNGCQMAIFIQRDDGGFTGLGRMAAIDFMFDRPNGMWPSFEAVVPGDQCGKGVFDSCTVRYELRNGQLRMMRAN